MSKPETMMIDDVKYVRADSVSEQATKLDGMEYAIVRSRNHGVLAGYIESYEGQTVHLRKARRVWYFKGCETLEELAKYGSKDIESCKICPVVEKETMLEACGIIYATEKARLQIEGASEWKS